MQTIKITNISHVVYIAYTLLQQITFSATSFRYTTTLSNFKLLYYLKLANMSLATA